MKLLSFAYGNTETYGVLAADGVIDVGRLFKGVYPDIKSVLAADALDQIHEATRGAPSDVELDEITFGPVIGNAEKMVCIGINYLKHVEEMGREVPPQPTLFLKLASALVGHGEDVVKPAVSDEFDFEGELALVIGKPGRAIPEDAAFEHIAGYTILNDGSVRDWQRENLDAGKNFPRTSGFGPWLVTADEIADPGHLGIETRLNGEVVQQDVTSGLIFAIPRLINYVSGFTELRPGDIISTGTPHGVGTGRTPPLYMKPGDTVEVEIEGIGTLRNYVVAE